MQDLSNYITPSWLYPRIATAEIGLHLVRPKFRDQVMAFERHRFPLWADFYANATADPEERNVIVAINSEGAVIGSVLLRVAGPARWDADWGVRHGTINCLGVAEDQQGKGIGLALAARAMEFLKERGCKKCYVQWTGLVDWYGKLGTSVWAKYYMGSKELL